MARAAGCSPRAATEMAAEVGLGRQCSPLRLRRSLDNQICQTSGTKRCANAHRFHYCTHPRIWLRPQAQRSRSRMSGSCCCKYKRTCSGNWARCSRCSGCPSFHVSHSPQLRAAPGRRPRACWRQTSLENMSESDGVALHGASASPSYVSRGRRSKFAVFEKKTE
jgi:hypothetical protein